MTIVQTSVDLPHGITLSVRSAGAPRASAPSSAPVLMFLHGFPEAAFVWDAMLEHFARPENGGYRCVAPNLRGFEQSSAPADPSAYRAKHLVQDIAALIAIESPGRPLAALVAHDWGGAVAWNLANQLPHVQQRLCIINSPHPGSFLRELAENPKQQAASSYMNFLCRPDAEALLAQDDFRRLFAMFTNMGALDGPKAWLTDEVRANYRKVWQLGLTGGCNYYRASPLRPPTEADPGAAAITLPDSMLRIEIPTRVLWGMGDTALPPELIDGLDAWIPDLRIQRVEDATHWIVHEQPQLVAKWLQQSL